MDRKSARGGKGPNAVASVVGESRVTMRLLELMRTTNYELVQINGQRRLMAPELVAETQVRAKGAEVFLGRLPRDCYEDEIVPILRDVGRLLELRLMLDFSGSTRGYAFALFENSTIAHRACRVLDGYEIRPGHKIGVVKSIDNCRLFFGGVPRDKTKNDFLEELGKILDDITNVYAYPDTRDGTRNRGFIFVEFKDHRSAAMARRKLIPGKVLLWNHEIAVDWADPEPGEPIDDDLMETVTALFVRNLTLETPHRQIRELLQRCTGIPILKVKKINHFAFVHYENRELAHRALEIMTQSGGIAEIYHWEVRWAKPVESRRITEYGNYKERRNSDNCYAAENQANTRSKSVLDKKRFKKVADELLYPYLHKDADYQQLLENYVFEKFCAVCRYHCYSLLRGNGYVCKISVVTTSEILFEFQGDTFPSQEQAIKGTAFAVYQRVRPMIDNHRELQLPYNDMRDSSHRNGSVESLKHEACR